MLLRILAILLAWTFSYKGHSAMVECTETFDQHKHGPEVSTCQSQTNQKEIQNIIDGLIKKLPQFEILKTINLQIRFYQDDEYFLKTFVRPVHTFLKSSKRTYYLDFNEKLFECAPNKSALTSILVHELFHIKDYVEFKTKDFVGLILQMSNKKGRTRYELQTDLKVLASGKEYAEGLKEYRKWIYLKLDKKQLETKKRYYLTPEEIDKIMAGGEPPARSMKN
jgi:hypothetical protein